MMQKIGAKLNNIVTSPWFWRVTLAFFVVQALWFVFSATYPMAFDEDFHFGVISIYANQWSPFLDGQPSGAAQFGSLATDPSYLFHYLMSFPLRFIDLFTNNQAAQVIFLRLINVAIVVWGLILLRKVMRQAGASTLLINTSLAVFVLIPIVPQLAAHINYDNLLILLLAWLCLLVFRLIDGFQGKRVDATALLLFVVVALGTSVVKYAALPLLVGAALFVGIMAFRAFRQTPRVLLKGLRGSFNRIGKRTKIVLLASLFIFTALFAQRYLVNTVKYHHPVPDCGAVLTVNECKQYGPWGRDHGYEQNKPDDFQPNLASFFWHWLQGMRHRLFFAVSGAGTAFVNYIELPIPVTAFTVLFVASILTTVIWWRQIFANPYLVFFMAMSLVYVLMLFYDQYGMYAKTSVPVAINGRYLIPILPLLAVIAGHGFALTLRRFKLPQLKPYLAALVILLFLQGGGMFTYLLRADESWYWYNSALRATNEAARKVVAPFVIEGDKYADWH